MIIGQYVAGDSFLHRLDVRTKLLFVLSYTGLLFAVKTTNGFLWMAFFVIVGWLLSGIPFLQILRSFRPVLWICMLMFIFHLWLTKGGPIVLQLGSFAIYEEGIARGTVVVVRLLLLILAASLFTLTTSPIDMTDGLGWLLKPLGRLGIPVSSFALMMSITLRFIPVVWEEADRIQKAQLLRGASLRSGPWHRRLQALRALFIPLLLSVFRRADELAAAMATKGYQENRPRTRWRVLAFGRLDLYFFFVWCFMVGGFFYVWR